MNTRYRLAAGAVALAAAATPAVALASDHAPAPVPAHFVTHHATHRGRVAPDGGDQALRGRTLSASVRAVPGPVPPAPGTTISPGTRAIDHDGDLLKAQKSNSAVEAGIPAWVACMNKAGLPTVATPTGVTAGGWTFVLQKTPEAEFLDSLAGEDARNQIEAECMVRTYHLHG